jgi:hypothetical protein
MLTSVGEFPDPNTPEWGVLMRQRADLIHKKVHDHLTAEEEAEYQRLLKGSLEVVEHFFPRPKLNIGLTE